MPNMSNKKVAMPEQDPKLRCQNFDEVAQGYTAEMAQEEAQRCLHCKNKPCISGCPVGVPIPDFIKKVAEGDLESAYKIIKSMNELPGICGRVCPQEKQCERKCVRGIKGEPVAIGRLERYVADYFMDKKKSKIEKRVINKGEKVAVIGSGPAGLVCAGELAKLGYDVTVFEALHQAGGVLVYGIPEFRLPKEIVRKEIASLKELGVTLETNVVIGKTLSIDDLFSEGFKAIFIGSGAGLPRFMNIPGEGLNGVYSANEFLTRINLMKAYRKDFDTPMITTKNVAVIGGGNVAMDAARCAKRIGAENVYIFYRRSEEEMPARKEEVQHALAEGVSLKTLCNPTRILGDDKGNVLSIECLKMKLDEPDESGRRRPVPVENSNFNTEVDCVVMAIGNSPNPLISSVTAGLKTDKRGCLVINEESLLTSRPMVFAGGDAVTGAATVILAMGAGKKAASSIHENLSRLKEDN